MTEAELLAAIYDQPDDDAPRLVYMDYLLDRGDPRGELISLQMRKLSRALSPDEQRAERMLLHAHVASWLPREILGKVQRASLRFERGFLARCHLRQSEQQRGSQQRGHPGWRTVHTIVAPGRGFGANRVLAAPELAHLRRLHLEPGRFVPWYLNDPAPKQLETLGLAWYAQDERVLVRQLVATKSLPQLRQLVIYLNTADALAELVASDLALQLDHLALWDERIWRTLPEDARSRVRHVTFDAFTVARRIFDF